MTPEAYEDTETCGVKATFVFGLKVLDYRNIDEVQMQLLHMTQDGPDGGVKSGDIQK